MDSYSSFLPWVPSANTIEIQLNMCIFEDVIALLQLTLNINYNLDAALLWLARDANTHLRAADSLHYTHHPAHPSAVLMGSAPHQHQCLFVSSFTCSFLGGFL